MSTAIPIVMDERLAGAPPMLFDGYRIIMALSQGHKSSVYIGHDTVLDRPVFVRFLHIPGPATARRKHFFAEARTAARVQHPNVVTVYRVGETDGLPYMILEYVPGQSLSSIKKPVPWEKALDYAFKLARGLAAAHRKNILHRDLRSSNVLLSGEGEIKILDFGLTDFSDAGSVAFELPAGGSLDAAVHPAPAIIAEALGVVGILAPHLAPELQRGEPATTRSDVFSLGALLYELCSGIVPAPGRTTAEGMAGSARPQRLPLGQLVPSINSHFAEIIDQCLEARPSRRYASGEHVLEALELLTNEAVKSDLPEGNPYRGLLRFEAEHRSLFFGRRSEIGTLLERLHTEPCYLIAAESGIGKSSLCRAGVLPLVREGAFNDGRKWRVVSMVPGRQPIRALVSALRTVVQWEEAALRDCLHNAPTTLARELSLHLPVGDGLLLFLDQLEELVTIANPDEATRVGEALGSLLDRTAGVRLLMTARSDFLSRIAALPGLGDSVSRCLYILRPLGPERLREVVVGPARAKGVRFESPELIASLVDSTAHADGGLPLLQFELAELWEAREGTTISAAALQTIGGVAGALARHADHVLSGMSEAQRTAARRILMALVTVEGTRARRGEAELLGDRLGERDVLERLVKGRIIVARDTAEGPAYEVAHEALIKGWGTLRQWLEAYLESRAVRQRLETAAAEWRRLGRPSEGLWSLRQLAELRLLDRADIGAGEREFISFSQRWTRRQKNLRNAALVALPVGLLLAYGAARYLERRDLQRRVAHEIERGEQERAAARRQELETTALRTRAFAAFDSQNIAEGETLWRKTQTTAAAADRAYSRAGQRFEAALAVDYANPRARDLLADTLYERAVAAERDHHTDQLEDLLQRLGVYDVRGERLRHWAAPGHVRIRTATAGARGTLGRYETDAKQKRTLTELRDLGELPTSELTLEPGSYLLTSQAPGRSEVRYPFVVTRGSTELIELELPARSAIPAGMIYIPPGKFLFGTTDETIRKSFLSTVPIHTQHTKGYLIARFETTYREWIDYLDALPPLEQQRLTGNHGKGGLSGAVRLSRLLDGRWQLTLQPTNQEGKARSDQPFVYRTRLLHAQQNWLRFPVGGVTYQEAQDYARWLDQSGRLRGARLCDEYEWERAARGADDREWPHGDQLDAGEANFDLTYNRDVSAIGPDEVGSYEQSVSPFGLYDMAGNAFEWARSKLKSDEPLVRSGGFFMNDNVQRATNRNIFDREFRDPQVGIRICADLPSAGR